MTSRNDPGSAARPGAVAVVAGATGLVGQALLRRLAADSAWREVRALARRPLPFALPAPSVVPVQVDYASIGSAPAWAAGVDQVFCALGTTMRQAGSREAFRQVDFEYPVAVAKAGLASGARHFLLVTALGADSESRIFYNRVKGEVEHAVAALGYRSLTIARPSLLLGARAEWRLGEQVGKVLGVLSPPRWRPIEADQVALALVAAARRGAVGIQILENQQLRSATA
jgi:uncharacterized protein YbjT (DUF2867 family)